MYTMQEKIEKAFSRPLTGILLSISLLIMVFLFIGKFVAQIVVDFTQRILFGTWYYNIVMSIGTYFLDPDTIIGCLLIGEYGILTMVPIYLLGLLLPLVFSFYFIMFLLEDSGLIYQIAPLTDKPLRHIGMTGTSTIPLLLGFGCVTAALISTSAISSKREQFIADALLSVAIPCSAQLTILMVVAYTLQTKYLLTYLITILSIFILIGLLLNLLLPGKLKNNNFKSIPLSIPSLYQTFIKTVRESGNFLIDAAPTFALGSILMAVLNYTNGFTKIHQILSPITSGLLHLPVEAADLFILLIIKKDLGAAGLYSIVSHNIMSESQITVALIVMTLFAPCFASTMILFKKWGLLITTCICISSFMIAFSVGGIIALFFY